MPRRMAFDVDVIVPAAVMYSYFTTEKYWEDLVGFYRENKTRTEIAHFSSDDTGTDISFAHILPPTDLPAIARPVLPGTFTITREQHFEPFDEAANQAPAGTGGDSRPGRCDRGLRVGRHRARQPDAPGDGMPGAGADHRRPDRGLLVNGLKTLFSREGRVHRGLGRRSSVGRPNPSACRPGNHQGQPAAPRRPVDGLLGPGASCPALLRGPGGRRPGYGRLPVTTLELSTRLRTVRPDLRVVGLEIDPERVSAALESAPAGVEFALGGFELAGLRPVLVRAFNVLRQYPGTPSPRPGRPCGPTSPRTG